MSIDQRSLNTQLPLDRRGTFEGNLGQSGRPCVITGYAVFGQGTRFMQFRVKQDHFDYQICKYQLQLQRNNCF